MQVRKLYKGQINTFHVKNPARLCFILMPLNMPINSAGRFDVSKSTVVTDNWTQMYGKNAGNNIKLHVSILSRG